MAHGHCHSHTHGKESNIKVAFFLNLFFTIIEFIGGFLTNSVAIMADAIHDLGDSISIGFAWKIEKISQKKKTNKYSYGYKRFSVLAAIINSLILILGSIYVLSESIPRLLNPEQSDYLGMFWLAILGILFNGYGAYKVIKGNSLNEKVISWHLIEDVFGWVGVLIISIVNFFIELPLLDPILAIVFTLFILWNVIKNFNNLIKIIMQSVPDNIDISKIEREVLKIKGITEIGDIHIWDLDGKDYILTINIIVRNNKNILELEDLKYRIKEVLIRNNIKHSTIEFSIKKEKCIY